MLVAIVAMVSCKKTEETPKPDPFNANSNVTASTNNSVATVMFDDVYRQVDISNEKMKDSCGGKKSNYELQSVCATITLGSGEFNLTTWPKHITVDFGTGCVGSDGRTRSGQITYVASDWMHNPGSVITVSTNNYYVDGYKVEGTKTITNQGRNNNNNLTWRVVVTNAVITHPTGEHHTWSTDRVTEWISGEVTILNPWDDKFSTKGGANGVTTTNENYTITIDNAHPLITEWTCRYIEEGIFTIQVGTQPVVTVDYGNTGCDANASFTVYGYTYNFYMP